MRISKILLLVIPSLILATESQQTNILTSVITNLNPYLLTIRSFFTTLKEKASGHVSSAKEHAKNLKQHAKNLKDRAMLLKDKTHAHIKTHLNNLKTKYDEYNNKEDLSNTEDLKGEERLRELLKKLTENMNQKQQGLQPDHTKNEEHASEQSEMSESDDKQEL